MPIDKFIKVCEKNVAGNMHLFLTEASNVYDVVVTAGEVSDIVMTGVTTFKEIQADQNGIVRQINQLGKEPGKEYYEHFVNFICGKATVTLNDLSNQLAEASSCGIIALVMDSNNQTWLVGWNEVDKGARPLYLNLDNFNSGKDLTDADGGKRIFDLKTTSGYLDLPTNANINQYILDSLVAGTDIGFTP